VAEEKQMKQTSNIQRPRLNAQFSASVTTSHITHHTSNVVWRILDFLIAGIFIFAGLTKILKLDDLIGDLQRLQFASALADVRNLSLANPAEFASDIDNFKILPWPISVALAFYLPWLEIFCALGFAFRFLYRGALFILGGSIVVFTLAITAARIRGLDITCGCFGHASQHWSFPAHLATNLAILGTLIALGFSNRLTKSL
jgi:uncharacterized membrane protein YphA (DoxX/SURF4 family)